MLFEHEAVILFLALFALYSPVAALSSYLPIVRPYSHAQQLRLAIGLAVNVAVFVLVAIWVGEPLLELLGISTAALTATGGIALLYASIPLMRGVRGRARRAGRRGQRRTGRHAEIGCRDHLAAVGAVHPHHLSADRRRDHFRVRRGGLSGCGRRRGQVAAVGRRGGLCRRHRPHAVRFGPHRAAHLPAGGHDLDRVAGILLTSIAVILLANGFTDLVVAALDRS
jgi:multiple antibiotic resistance protein